jgi:hypothetical protein
MTDLTRQEIAAIAEHEHVPELTAALQGDYEMHLHHGAAHVQGMICDDIKDALHRKDLKHAKELYATLHAFIEAHPEAVRGSAG